MAGVLRRRVLSCCSKLNVLEKLDHPVVYTDLTTNWNARWAWSAANLKSRYGDRLFSCGMDITTDEPILMLLREYFEMIETQQRHSQQTPLYLFDASFDEDCPELTADYSTPDIFLSQDLLLCLPKHLKPDHKWLLIGGEGSGSKLHTDPLATSAWNALLVGRKEWVKP